MKKLLSISLAMLCGCQLLQAAPIDSQVIHHYTEVGVGYTYAHDFAGDGEHGHGITGGGSIDLNNVLLGVGAGYTWGDDVEVWGVTGNVGYVFRLLENHINIIPRVGVGYSEVSVDLTRFGFGELSADSTTISPGITASYAFCNWFSANAGYTYVRDIDFDEDLDAHTFGIGARLALTERIGLDIGIGFAEEQGFSGASASVSFHF